MIIGSALVALTLAASPPAGAPVPASAVPPLPGVSKYCNSVPAVRRRAFIMAGCAGAPPVAEHVVWTRLTRTGGKAHGDVLLDDCRPDCAGGTVYSDGAVFTFFRVRRVAGAPAFTRVVVDLVGPRNDPLSLPRHNVWAISQTY